MCKRICLFILCLVVLLGTCGCEKNKETDNKEENIKVNENIEDNRVDENTGEDVKENEKVETGKPNKNNASSTNKNTDNTDNKVVDKENTSDNNKNNNSDNNKDNNDINNTINNNSNNNGNNNDDFNKDDNDIENDNKVEPVQEEITITKENLYDFFEIKRVDIITEVNAFGERGTEEDFYYTLVLSLKNAYKSKLISSNVSVEFASETYLRSFNYNRQTGIGTVTDEYRHFYNNTDKFLCDIKNGNACDITMCHIAGSTYINGKLVYYAYITEKLEPIRVAGSIVLKK